MNVFVENRLIRPSVLVVDSVPTVTILVYVGGVFSKAITRQSADKALT